MLLDDITALIKGLPELPTLLDRGNIRRVFTDRSYIPRTRSIVETDGLDAREDNEQLAYIGSAILRYCADVEITNRYPQIQPGPATIVNSEVISQKNLVEIAKGYKLGDRLCVNPASPYIRTNDRALGTVFKAYIGALHQEQNITVVKRWLSDLLGPFQQFVYGKDPVPTGDPEPPEYFQENPGAQSSIAGPSTGTPQTLFHSSATPVTAPIPVDILNQLNCKLVKHGRPLNKLNWYDENIAPGQSPSSPVWSVRVHYEGALIGEGGGTTKKEARKQAAVHALRWLNRSL